MLSVRYTLEELHALHQYFLLITDGTLECTSSIPAFSNYIFFRENERTALSEAITFEAQHNFEYYPNGITPLDLADRFCPLLEDHSTWNIYLPIGRPNQLDLNKRGF